MERENSETILIIIERFDKSNNIVLFDFVDSNAFETFNSLLDLQYDWINNPNMIQVTNYKQKKIREGTVYRVAFDVLRSLKDRISLVKESFIIGFSIQLDDNDLSLFGKSKSFNDSEKLLLGIEEPFKPFYNNLDLGVSKLSEIVIRNIGQGSWNELLADKKYEIIFDIGTIYTTSKTAIQTLIGNRDKEYQKSKPILLLSHWDVDHYHFLLALEDNTIKSFEAFIYRGILPNLTARKALGRFKMLNHKKLFPVSPESPLPKRSSSKLKQLTTSPNSAVLIYNASKNASRNRSGLGLAIRKISTSVIFSADFNYSQVSNYILPDLNYPCDHYLIVPHHGGNAGKFEYKINLQNRLIEAIISVGKNPYKPRHPYSKNIQELKKTGFKIVRTDNISSDYIINL